MEIIRAINATLTVRKITFILLAAFASAICVAEPTAAIRVPAFTAYSEPDSDGLSISQRESAARWRDPSSKILWFGELKNPGKIQCAITLRLDEGAEIPLRLTVAGQTHDSRARGAGTNWVTIDFGSFDIATNGYECFKLETSKNTASPVCNLGSLILDGPAASNAHFNLKPRRNAASVHLSYPTPRDAKIAAFYCELTPLEDPLWTYYMACGWHRGYFGMQVNSPTERRLIFSVWDSGKEAKDRANVGGENRVTLVAKGEGVVAGDFGNEGTGGHSHLIYPWKTGEKQRFLVTAKPDGEDHAIFSGYYFDREKKKWRLLSSWRAPHETGWMHGLYSFNENFGGDNGELRRRALFGNQWIKWEDGQWTELTTASFSHDQTGRNDRLDRFMGLEQGEFFLSNGGFVPGFTRFGEKFARPSSGKPPSDIELPSLHE